MSTLAPGRQVATVASARRHRLLRRLAGHRGAQVGAAVAVVLVLAFLVGPLLWHASTTALHPGEMLLTPSGAHPLGTDEHGRDELARLIAGGRRSLLTVVAVIAVALAAGLLAGIIAGVAGGPVDAVISRVTDVVLAFPPIVASLVTLAVLGPGLIPLVAAVAVSFAGEFVRMARTYTLTARGRPVVIAARLSGIPWWRTVAGHVLPETTTKLIVVAALDAGHVIVSVAGLSFLGFRLAGQQLVGLAPRQHRALRGIMVGLVPQDPFAACDPLRPVRDHLDEAWRAHARRPEPGEVDGLLIDVGLDPARTRARPHQWSGGMLQRATIAAATAHRPALVVADEPTSALDAALREEILEVLHARSRSLLLISHDLTLVAGHAETVAVCYAGRIVEVGSVAEVLTAPRHPYTRALLAAVPRPRHSPPRPLPGAPPDLTDPPIGCAFASRCPLVEDHCRVEEPQIRDGVACPVVTR